MQCLLPELLFRLCFTVITSNDVCVYAWNADFSPKVMLPSKKHQYDLPMPNWLNENDFKIKMDLS